MCFFLFACIWDRFATTRNLLPNAPNWCNKCKGSCHDVWLEFFATNAPDPHHWNLNSSFGAFLSIWVHLEPFLYCTKLAAKHDKLVQLTQNFVPWYLVRIFGTNAPYPHHWILNSCFCAFVSVLVHLVPFCCCTKLAVKRTKVVQIMQKFVPRCLFRTFRNEHSRSQHCTQNSCFGVFLSVWVHLEPFCYCTKLGAKRAKLVQLMQKFVPRCLDRIFCNERSRSRSLDPKLMFLCVSFRLRAFGTVLLLHETCYKTRQTGVINAKVHATMSC